MKLTIGDTTLSKPVTVEVSYVDAMGLGRHGKEQCDIFNEEGYIELFVRLDKDEAEKIEDYTVENSSCMGNELPIRIVTMDNVTIE